MCHETRNIVRNLEEIIATMNVTSNRRKYKNRNKKNDDVRKGLETEISTDCDWGEKDNTNGEKRGKHDILQMDRTREMKFRKGMLLRYTRELWAAIKSKRKLFVTPVDFH
jgi:hypothetical protein